MLIFQIIVDGIARGTRKKKGGLGILTHTRGETESATRHAERPPNMAHAVLVDFPERRLEQPPPAHESTMSYFSVSNRVPCRAFLDNHFYRGYRMPQHGTVFPLSRHR